jgi:hypothetical protein
VNSTNVKFIVHSFDHQDCMPGSSHDRAPRPLLLHTIRSKRPIPTSLIASPKRVPHNPKPSNGCETHSVGAGPPTLRISLTMP